MTEKKRESGQRTMAINSQHPNSGTVRVGDSAQPNTRSQQPSTAQTQSSPPPKKK